MRPILVSVGETLVFFRLGDTERPVLKVSESPGQVVIVIRSEPNEHLTLHRQDDGSVLLTHWSPDKPLGTWDKHRVSAARKLDYAAPDKHAHYITHHPLRNVIGMDGHHLVGRRINLYAATPRAKYERAQRVTIEAPSPEFMLTFSLATPEQPYSTPDDPHVVTSFGQLYFRPESD